MGNKDRALQLLKSAKEDIAETATLLAEAKILRQQAHAKIDEAFSLLDEQEET